MTNEEAIKIIEDKTSINEPLELYEALKLAIEALEKQIPKTVVKKRAEDKRVGNCPTCKSSLCATHELYNYCHKCGQRLDWSE